MRISPVSFLFEQHSPLEDSAGWPDQPALGTTPLLAGIQVEGLVLFQKNLTNEEHRVQIHW
jgi:hypothetical protein